MKKILALLLALAMVFALASCSVEKAPENTGSADPDASGDNQGTEQVEITWWAFPTFGTDTGYEEELIAAFNEVHPEIKINLTIIDFTSGQEQLTAAIEANTAPDLLFDAPGRIIEYGKAGKLVSLDDMFTDEMKADVTEAVISACSDGTTYWMYPLSSAPFYMGINLEMFQAAGADQYLNLEGDRCWTTEDFQNACKALAEAGYVPGIVYCGGQGGDQGTRALVSNLYGAHIANDAMTEYTMNSAEGVEAMTLLQEMVNAGYLDVATDMVASQELEMFQTQNCAMTFCWGTSNAISYASEDFTQISVPFPSDDGVPELETLHNGFCVFDNGDDAKAAAAKLFAQFICDDAEWGPKSVVQTGAFPVRASFGNLYEGNEEMELLSSWTQYYADYYNTMDGFATMRVEWWNMLQRVLASGGDPQTELDTYVANSNAALNG